MAESQNWSQSMEPKTNEQLKEITKLLKLQTNLLMLIARQNYTMCSSEAIAALNTQQAVKLFRQQKDLWEMLNVD